MAANRTLNNVIRAVSEEFESEAIASPRMLEDLSAMERYMAESYNGRTIIELLQNADDAGSSRLKICKAGGALLIANDGRQFNEDDVLAICRSGASGKTRGESIGYRGIGFKSATCLSTEIIICSGGASFTFSKTECARRLKLRADRVPTVRIPFLFDDCSFSNEESRMIRELQGEGLHTIFAFRNANMSKAREEISDFTSEWLLFLRSVCKADISFEDVSKSIVVQRKELSHTDSILSSSADRKNWYKVVGKKASIAFACDVFGSIGPCDSTEAVFHCFLPTLDKSGYPFKVNADFSTDPSRKHVIQDEVTEAALSSAAEEIANLVVRQSSQEEQRLAQLIDLLCSKNGMGAIASKLEQRINSYLEEASWVPVVGGGVCRPEEVFLFPKWLDEDDRKYLLNAARLSSKNLIEPLFLSLHSSVETLIRRLGAKDVSQDFILRFIMESSFASSIPPSFAARLFAFALRTAAINGRSYKCSILPFKQGRFSLDQAPADSLFDPTFEKALENELGHDELKELRKEYSLFFSRNRQSVKDAVENINASGIAERPALSKWKTPAQNCEAVEASFGNTTTKANSKKNGYDLISQSGPDVKCYVIGKEDKNANGSFKLSEVEYEAARKNGPSYCVCLLSESEGEISFSRIFDPIAICDIERVAKEWEWLCSPRNDHGGNGAGEKGYEEPSNTMVLVDDMSGIEFEEYCAHLLEANGFEDVSMTKSSGDQGADIIATRDGIKLAIQCKCYSSDVGNDAVQEVFAGRMFYGCHLGVVLTNRDFTNSAKQLAETNGVVLWNRSQLLAFAERAQLQADSSRAV